MQTWPRSLRIHAWLGACLLWGLGCSGALSASPVPSADLGSKSKGLSLYAWRQEHDPDGIGKFFLGREIAQVMGYEGAEWLERPERATEERPDLLLEHLHLKQGEAVADIGAGSGVLSLPLAGRVGPGGRVYAVDVQPEMLRLLTEKCQHEHVTNVIPVLGSTTNANLPTGKVDLAVMVDVYHEFSFPYEMIETICRSLRPGGRIVLVEYRAEDPSIPIKALHKMSAAQVRKEMSVHALDWLETSEVLPRQHIFVFQKRSELEGADGGGRSHPK